MQILDFQDIKINEHETGEYVKIVYEISEEDIKSFIVDLDRAKDITRQVYNRPTHLNHNTIIKNALRWQLRATEKEGL